MAAPGSPPPPRCGTGARFFACPMEGKMLRASGVEACLNRRACDGVVPNVSLCLMGALKANLNVRVLSRFGGQAYLTRA